MECLSVFDRRARKAKNLSGASVEVSTPQRVECAGSLARYIEVKFPAQETPVHLLFTDGSVPPDDPGVAPLDIREMFPEKRNDFTIT
jgi:hypothetical protein